MSGTVRIIGYNEGSNGPDLAKVEANQQMVSHLQNNSPALDFIAYSVKSYVGNWFSPAVIRYGIWAASSASSAPGGLLASTIPVAPTVNYVDAAGGQERTLDLETPLLIRSTEWVAAGIGSASNAAGIAMFQASAISQPNENFYRKGISGNSLQSASGSSAPNEGQLAIAIFGEYNVAPTAPTDTLPASGLSETSRTPNISGDFNDANKTLNNGKDWDYAIQAQIQMREGATVIWDYPYTTTSAERNSHRTVRRYSGPALDFYTTYNYRIRHMDRAGEWGAFSDFVYFSIRHDNRTPNLPSGFAGLGTVNGSRTITVGSTFTDPDLPLLPDGQAWERFEYKQVIVRRVSDNAIVWNPGAVATTSGEKSSRKSSSTFTLPAWDTQYRWYERHRDRTGAWSTYASGTVIALSGGSVDKPTTPSGRVTNMLNPGNISYMYRSTGSINGNLTRVGIFYPDGSGPRSERDVVTTSTPNVAKAIAWATLWSDIGAPGFPFQEPGTDWLYAVRVRDVNGNWTAWSPFQELNLNAAPLTPVLYGPADGNVSSYLNTTSVRVTDTDQPASELTVTAEYYDAGTDALIGSLTLPWLPGNGGETENVFGATPTSLITGYRSFKWRARANDGYLDSAWSQMWTVTWADVPDVTVTAPTGPTVTTSQPLFEWVSTDQVAWRIVGRNADNVIVYDTGAQAGSDQLAPITSTQYWFGAERWNNGEEFIWTVMVQDSSTLWGSSAPLPITLSYIPPTPLVVQTAAAMSFEGVKGTHYAFMQMSQTEYIEGEFLRYEGDRWEIDGPDGAEIPGSHLPQHFVSGNSADTSFFDFDVTSNTWYRWAFRQVVQLGIDTIPSEPVFVELMVSWSGTLLHMPFDPINNYVWLPFGTERYEPEAEWFQGASSVMAANGRAPIGYSDSTDYVEWRLESTLIPRESMTSDQQRDALRTMWKYQNKRYAPNGRPNSVCFREGRGGDDGRVYGRISEARRRHSHARLYTIDFMFRELEELSVEGGGV